MADVFLWQVTPDGPNDVRLRDPSAGSGGTDALTANSVAAGVPSVGSPALTQVHALTANSVASGVPSVGAPTLTQVHALAADGVVSGVPTVGAPVLGGDVPSVAPKGAAGDNYRRPRKRGRTWTLAEWQEEQRRRREQPAGLLHDVEIPQAAQPIPSPPGMALPTGAFAWAIPPLELPPLPSPRAVPAAWQDDEEEELELLLLA
jgi:hypothetical protein